MNVRKFFIGIFVPFLLIIPAVEAYQELHEPDIVYIEYESENGAVNALGLYESAANGLISEVGRGCFQVITDVRNKNPIQNKIYRLLNTEDCNGDDSLFSKALEFYQQAINAPPDEVTINMASKIGVVRARIGNVWSLKCLSVTVNIVKEIITELSF